MTTLGLWDRLASEYGSPTPAGGGTYTIAGEYSPTPTAQVPTASQPGSQAPRSALTPTGASPSGSALTLPSVKTPGASPNYLGLAKQGISNANSLLGGNSALGDVSAGLGLYSGIKSGTPLGYAGAALNASRLANSIVGKGTVPGVGAAGDALGIYSGLTKGGVGGYGSAALDAYDLYNTVGSLAGAGAAGGAAAGSAAAAGASTAAATLGQYVPVVGMLLSAYLESQTPAYTMHPSWYENVNKTLNAGPGAAAQRGSAGYYDPQSEKQLYDYNAALGEVQGEPGYGNFQQSQPLAGVPYSTNGSPSYLRSGNVGGGSHPTMKAARGGSMQHNNRTIRNPQLRKLYEGSFANRKRHFADGGSYLNYADYTNTLSDLYQSAPPIDYSSLVAPNDSQQSLQQYLTNNTPSTGYDASGNQFNVNENANPIPTGLQEGNNPALQTSKIPGLSMQTGSALGSGGLLSGLGSALGVSSMGELLQKYGALAPLITAALGGNKPASAPATPAGYGPIPSIPTPANNRSYTQPTVANWYTYGQGPEQSFFSNNQLPTVQGMSPGTGAAGATATPPAGAGTPQGTKTIQPILPGANTMAHGGAFDSTQGDSYVPDPGHGDGTSDDVDAKLSGGEYVMDGGTVSMLGNGSNEAGARALDQLRVRVRKHAGKQLVKGKQFMKAKAPGAYLSSGKG